MELIIHNLFSAHSPNPSPGQLNDGQTITSLDYDKNTLPDTYVLYQSYPNPFNPSTNIQYSIPKQGFVKLVVYDLLGKEVRVIVNEQKEPGNYEVTFNAGNLASGMYFYKLNVEGKFNSVKKMLLVK